MHRCVRVHKQTILSIICFLFHRDRKIIDFDQFNLILRTMIRSIKPVINQFKPVLIERKQVDKD